MRQGVIKGIITGIAVLLLAPGAFAATPNDIYRDLADGKLDGTYTKAEMDAFLSSAQVQGYGNPIVVTPAPVPQPPKAGGVAGDQKTIASPAPQQSAGVAGAVSPSQAPLTQTASAETLPFTGAELGLFALVGAALLLGGLLLRASARQR